MAEFLARVRAGIGGASERARARYGFPCSCALDRARRFDPDAGVLRLFLR